MPTPRLRIGQLLVDARLITAAALDETLAVQRTDGRRLGTLLVERGLINETQLTQILSHQLSVPWVSLLHIEFSRQLLNLVPRAVADRFCLVPIYVRHVRHQGDTLYVAMDDPSNEEGLAACREHAGLPVRSMIAPPTDIRSAIRVYYGVDPSGAPAPSAPSPKAAEPEPAAPAKAPEEAMAAKVPEQAAPAPAITDPAPAAEVAPTPVSGAPPDPSATPQEPADRHPTPATVEIPAPAVALAPLAPLAPPEVKSEPPRVKAPAGPSADGPEIEAVEIPVDLASVERLERLRGVLEPPETPPPPSSPAVENIPRPRGRAPRMVSLTLLDGTTINLPAKRRPRRGGGEEAPAATGTRPSSQAPSLTSEPPGGEGALQGLTARDLVLALRVVANGADASEVLGENLRWEALFSALLSLMLKKHLIADWEFIDELKKQL